MELTPVDTPVDTPVELPPVGTFPQLIAMQASCAYVASQQCQAGKD